MFVTKSTHQKVVNENAALWAAYRKSKLEIAGHIADWNRLVGKINRGEYVLASKQPAAPAQLTLDEINTLIRLCHPDKHGGSSSANDITARLLKLRDKARS